MSDKKESNVLSDILSIYSNLDPATGVEKRIEILNLMFKYSKQVNESLPENIIRNIRDLMNEPLSDCVSYILRDDLLSIELSIELLEFIDDKGLVEKYAELFTKNLNEGWSKFNKDENIVNIMIKMAYLCESVSVTRFREEFSRMTLNTLLEIRNNHLLRLKTGARLAKYFKDINMSEQAETLLKAEMENIPVKIFIKYLKEICSSLGEYGLLNENTEHLLLPIIDKNVPDQYKDDVIIYIVSTYYDYNNIDAIFSLIPKFNNLENVLLFLLHNIEEDLRNHKLSEEQREEKSKLFDRLYQTFKEEMGRVSPAVLHRVTNISGLLNEDNYSSLLNDAIFRLKRDEKANPDYFSDFLYNIV